MQTQVKIPDFILKCKCYWLTLYRRLHIMVRLMIEDSTYTIIHVVPKKDLFEIFHTNSEANASEFV